MCPRQHALQIFVIKNFCEEVFCSRLGLQTFFGMKIYFTKFARYKKILNLWYIYRTFKATCHHQPLETICIYILMYTCMYAYMYVCVHIHVQNYFRARPLQCTRDIPQCLIFLAVYLGWTSVHFKHFLCFGLAKNIRH